MRIINAIKYLLATAAVIFIFFDWRISIVLLIAGSLAQVFPLGPRQLLIVIAGYLIIGGFIYLFIDWRIGAVLIFGALLMTKFTAWGEKVNREYYKKTKILPVKKS